MRPLHFGDASAPLFGLYHEPPGAPRGGPALAVVLLPPAPFEYNMSHWAMRKLAAQLSREGLPVLRFDYSGTGDSAGDPGDGDLERWVADALTACDEVREQSGARALALVGLRLGGTLALDVAARRPDVAEVVAWDPVVQGADYLRELAALDRRERLLRLLPLGGDGSLLGFRVGRPLRRGLRALDAGRLRPLVTGRVTLVASPGRPEVARLARALSTGGVDAQVEELAGESRGAAGGQAALLGSEPLDRIATALTERRRP